MDGIARGVDVGSDSYLGLRRRAFRRVKLFLRVGNI
jgi:hypothetical protein